MNELKHDKEWAPNNTRFIRGWWAIIDVVWEEDHRTYPMHNPRRWFRVSLSTDWQDRNRQMYSSHCMDTIEEAKDHAEVMAVLLGRPQIPWFMHQRPDENYLKKGA